MIEDAGFVVEQADEAILPRARDETPGENSAVSSELPRHDGRAAGRVTLKSRRG